MPRQLLTLISAGLLAMNIANADDLLMDTQHNPIAPATLKGKWVILSYWASWCGACQMEAPELNHLYETNTDDNLVIYGVNFDHDGGENMINGAKKIGIKYPLLYGDPRMAWKLGEVSMLPTMFIIDPEGKVVGKILGAHDEAAIKGLLNELKKK